MSKYLDETLHLCGMNLLEDNLLLGVAHRMIPNHFVLVNIILVIYLYFLLSRYLSLSSLSMFIASCGVRNQRKRRLSRGRYSLRLRDAEDIRGFVESPGCIRMFSALRIVSYNNIKYKL